MAMPTLKPRFKDKALQSAFESALQLAANTSSEFYHQGKPRRGAGHRCAFWDGVEYGKPMTSNVIPGTMNHAFFQAGKEWARRLKKAAN